MVDDIASDRQRGIVRQMTTLVTFAPVPAEHNAAQLWPRMPLNGVNQAVGKQPFTQALYCVAKICGGETNRSLMSRVTGELIMLLLLLPS